MGGHWIPQMIGYAGEVDGLGSLGEPSQRIDWDSVVEYQPETIVLSPCGFDVQRVLEEVQVLSYSNKIPAFQSSNIYAVNATAYFSRPGPRVVDGLEMLANIMHPDMFPQTYGKDDLTRIEPAFLKT